jgi:hypothetical protein
MRACVLFAVLLGLGGSLSAQSRHPNTREGFWIGLGVGSGSTGLDCTDCTSDRTAGPSGYIRAGATLSPKVLLGVEGNGWAHSQGTLDESVGYGSVILMWYPSRTGAFYLKLGLGGMSYRGDDGVDVITATASSGSFGLGYEFRVGRNFSLVPYLNSLASSAVKTQLNGQPNPTNEDISITLVQFGLGATWH